MKIEKLSSSSLKITLNKSDFSRFGISYDSWDSDITAGFLLSISEKIKAKTNIDLTREKLYVEIFSRSSGCLIFISFPYRNSTGNSYCRLACSFCDYDSLKRFCRLMKDEFPDVISASSLFYSSHVLRLEIKIPQACRELIYGSPESGYVTDCDDISDAAVLEYYNCAESDNAAEKIAYAQ